MTTLACVLSPLAELVGTIRLNACVGGTLLVLYENAATP